MSGMRHEWVHNNNEEGKHMDVRIREQKLPGIGHRYEMPLDDDRLLILVVEGEGCRELGIARTDADEPTAVVTLSHDQAVAIAALLTGARFTIETDQHDVGRSADVSVETVTLGETSPAVGRLVRDVPLAPGSDAAVLAVIRDVTPQLLEDAATEPCRAGDRIVVAARQDRLGAVVRELAG